MATLDELRKAKMEIAKYNIQRALAAYSERFGRTQMSKEQKMIWVIKYLAQRVPLTGE